MSGTKLERAARQLLQVLDCGMIDINRVTELREALAEQAEQDLNTCPGCGGVADNGHDREFPPNPYYCTKCTEQAEQEPVAWWFQPPNKNVRPMFDTQQHGGKWKPLYAAPVQQFDLTDDEIAKALGFNIMLVTAKELKDARAVIAADREKNK